MFNITYRTISTFGKTYPSNIATVGSHKASCAAEASNYIKNKFGNVEILSIEFVGSL